MRIFPSLLALLLLGVALADGAGAASGSPFYLALGDSLEAGVAGVLVVAIGMLALARRRAA